MRLRLFLPLRKTVAIPSFHFDFAALDDSQRGAVKGIVAKLLRSIRGGQSSGGGGESEEAYAADGANLHVYVALVKIASSESTGSFQVRE